MKTVYAYLMIPALLGACVHSFGSDEIGRFAALYKQAKGEIQKRKVCLEFIDAELLYDGSPIADVRKAFQQDFEEMGMDDHSNRLAIVRFVRPPPATVSPEGLVGQVRLVGWYLSITYGPDGKVMHYSLGNESKEPPTRLLRQKTKEGRTNEDPGLPVVEPPRSQ